MRFMNMRLALVTMALGSAVSPAVFAQDSGGAAADPSKITVQAQMEMLPLGSMSASAGGLSISTDTELAYGVSAGVDYAVTPYLRIGAAPRLVLNVKADGSMSESSGKEIDLRARIVGHYPVAPGLELSASLFPGYTIVTSGEDGGDNSNGFAIGGAVGATYDLTPKTFLGAEVGYQRAFATTQTETLGQKFDADIDVSYMHIGLGAGVRF
jgi:opacity protein-like surface antigen